MEYEKNTGRDGENDSGGVAQGLLGDMESIGGFCEAALLGGHEKVVHGKKVHIKPPEYKKKV